MDPITIVTRGAISAAVLWSVSGTLAVILGWLLARGLEGRRRTVRIVSQGLTFLARGIPTSLYVLAAGIVSLRWMLWVKLPNLFFGTPSMFQPVALAVCFALAFASAGHIAVVLQTSWRALPLPAREQFGMLSLGFFDRKRLVLTECASTILPPLSARLVHHLHNTAFAALFPVADLFGAVQGAADTSARVFLFVSLGAGAYACMSFTIWIGLRAIERALIPRFRHAAVAK